MRPKYIYKILMAYLGVKSREMIITQTENTFLAVPISIPFKIKYMMG